MIGKIITAFIGLAILVAIMPFILDQLAALEGTITGYCGTSDNPSISDRVSVGDDLRILNGVSGTTSVLCTTSTTGSPAGLTLTGVTAIHYIPTASSTNQFATVITTIISLWPILLFAVVLFAVIKMFTGSAVGDQLSGLIGKGKM